MQNDPQQDILGPKLKNYEFLKLVRQKQYGPALKLGRQILKQSPNNASVQKFVQFIQKNGAKLEEMVKEQQQYQSVHSSDSSQQQEGQEQGQNAQQKESDQQKSQNSKEEQEQQQEEQEQSLPKKKIESQQQKQLQLLKKVETTQKLINQGHQPWKI